MGDSTQREGELLKLEREIFDAFELPGDSSAIERLYHEDFLSINADGSTSTKQEVVEIVEQGVFPVSEEVSNEDALVRRFGDIAIITGRSEFVDPADELTTEVAHTQTWVNEDGQWQMVGWQGTPVEGAPAAGPDL